MALLAEELVEEWLNRQGYFTIRGLKIGVSEMDLLAIKVGEGGIERRHIEVQASVNPISYVCGLPKDLQKSSGRGPFSAARRTPADMRASVAAWLHKKFDNPKKHAVRQRLCHGEWTRELVVNVVKYDEELVAIQKSGVKVHTLPSVIQFLLKPKPRDFTASGTDLVGLLLSPALLPQSKP